MECEEFILPDWSPPDDSARPCRPKAGHGLVMIIMINININMIIMIITNTSSSITIFHASGRFSDACGNCGQLWATRYISL